MTQSVDNNKKIAHQSLPSPLDLQQQYPLSDQAAQTISTTRQAIKEVLHGRDRRLLLIVGPCSIHEPDGAMAYAQKLKQLADELSSICLVVMRCYFAKPRSVLGWKGFINDPWLDQSHDIAQGLALARQLTLEINQIGLATGCEFLNPMLSLYLADLMSWGAIGARTVESQPHRELASSLPMPIGFKNNTAGDLSVAIEAMQAASKPHHFVGLTVEGRVAIRQSIGNPDCHLILRGSKHGPNHHASDVINAATKLQQQSMSSRILIDCSHGNSGKNYAQQTAVVQEIQQQIAAGNHAIMGLMLESYLVPGRQALSHRTELRYGQSITDGCLGWEQTAMLLRRFCHTLSQSQAVTIR